MRRDLTELLKEWKYESGQINVRLIRGDDGEAKLQMRLDLGVLQMNVSGRPDGTRPEGYPSLLEYHEALVDEAMFSDGTGEAGDEVGSREEVPYSLSAEACRQLREEAVQFYHRYVSLLVLGEYGGVIRDTSRNLRLIDFCGTFAEEDDDREALEQFRPYITMMRTRAVASQLHEDEETKAALWAIDGGLGAIKSIYERSGREEAFERSAEAQMLRSMRDELSRKLPASQKSELRQRLDDAIRAENYELAAILRDELKMLRDQ
jgi:hypothetical protein